MITAPTPTQDIPEAADYAEVDKLLAEQSRRHEVLAAVDLWQREFNLFRQTLKRIGLDDEDETQRNAFLNVVRRIKNNGRQMLAAIEEHGIDTEKECGIRLAALEACVEDIEGYENMLFIDPEIEARLKKYFGVK